MTQPRRGVAFTSPITVVIAARPAIAMAQPPVPAADSAQAGGIRDNAAPFHVGRWPLDAAFHGRGCVQPLDFASNGIVIAAVGIARGGRTGCRRTGVRTWRQHFGGPGERGRVERCGRRGAVEHRGDSECDAQAKPPDGPGKPAISLRLRNHVARRSHASARLWREFPSIADSHAVKSRPSNDGVRK
jgi:hypothetical protein